MNKAWLVAVIPGVLAVVFAAFVLALCLLKLLWSWAIPDIFPGAVQQGLIARDLSWYTAFKLAIFVAVMAGFAGARGQYTRTEVG